MGSYRFYAKRDLTAVAKVNVPCQNCPLNSSCYDYKTNIWHPSRCEDNEMVTTEQVYGFIECLPQRLFSWHFIIWETGFQMFYICTKSAVIMFLWSIWKTGHFGINNQLGCINIVEQRLRTMWACYVSSKA